MSRMTSVGLVTNTLTEPFVPAGTMAAFATILPKKELSVDTNGWFWPVGQRLRYASGPLGTTVTFSENARAVDGIPHELDVIGKSRVWPPLMLGAPKAPFRPESLRVSATRH